MKLKVLSGQEIFNYFIDQIHLQDNELLIWAVKKEKKKLPGPEIWQKIVPLMGS